MTNLDYKEKLREIESQVEEFILWCRSIRIKIGEEKTIGQVLTRREDDFLQEIDSPNNEATETLSKDKANFGLAKLRNLRGAEVPE